MSVHRSYLEIDVAALKHNLMVIKSMTTQDCQFMAVVKGNAWGAGTLECATAFIAAGADWMGVTTIEDATLLRHEFDIPILLMCEQPGEKIAELVGLNIDLTVYSMESARLISQAATAQNCDVNIHIKINTGLNRVGIPSENAVPFFNQIMQFANLKIAGIFSHFSSADEWPSGEQTRIELSLFNQTIDKIKAHTHWTGLTHIANTAATISLPESHLDMVRVSIGLMGLYINHPFAKIVNFRQVFSWKTEVAHVINVKKDERVGYGGLYACPADTTIVTIQVGWADGLPKAYINGGQVLIRGSLHPIVAISMDMTTIDLAARSADIAIGEEVVIFGMQQGETLEPMAQGETVGIDADATLSVISARVPRIYAKA